VTARDALSRVGVALVAVVDTTPAVVAITGRPDGNVWRYGARIAVQAPSLAYLTLEADERSDNGDGWEVTVVLQAEGRTPDEAHALLEAAIAACTPQAFSDADVDAVILSQSRTTVPDVQLGADSPARPNAAIAEVDLLIWITLS